MSKRRNRSADHEEIRSHLGRNIVEFDEHRLSDTDGEAPQMPPQAFSSERMLTQRINIVDYVEPYDDAS